MDRRASAAGLRVSPKGTLCRAVSFDSQGDRPEGTSQLTQQNGPDDLHGQIVEVIPNLRAFARSLVSNPSQADDLVQGALTRALSNLDKFEVGTTLRPWMFTILRNLYSSELRTRRRGAHGTDGGCRERAVSGKGGTGRVD